MHKYDKHIVRKAIVLTVSDFVSPEEVKEIIGKLATMTRNIDVDEYSLIISAKGYKLPEPEVVPAIQDFFRFCTRTPFKNVFVIFSDFRMVHPQVQKIDNGGFYERAVAVDSVEEALKRIK